MQGTKDGNENLLGQVERGFPVGDLLIRIGKDFAVLVADQCVSILFTAAALNASDPFLFLIHGGAFTSFSGFR